MRVAVCGWHCAADFLAPLVSLALRFARPHYCALGLFGVTPIASLSGDAVLKGLVIGVTGVLLDVIGVYPVSGWPRLCNNSLLNYVINP